MGDLIGYRRVLAGTAVHNAVYGKVLYKDRRIGRGIIAPFSYHLAEQAVRCTSADVIERYPVSVAVKAAVELERMVGTSFGLSVLADNDVINKPEVFAVGVTHIAEDTPLKVV